jgi:TRAP-type C4-dicarboxylate transport system permease small subunit
MRRLIPLLIRFPGTLMVANLVAMMLLTVVDVVGRYLFNRPVPGTSEIIEYLLAILVFGALPLATLRREHIVVDILDFAIQGSRKRIQQIVVHFVSAATLGFIGWRLWARAAELGSYGDITQFLQLPLAPLAFAMSILAGVTAAVMIVLLAAALRGAPEPFRNVEN